MKVALEFWQKEATTEIERLTRLRTRFEEGLKAALPEIIIHGQTAPRLPQTSNIAFPGLEAQMLLLALDVAGVACSIGAACASGSAEPSPTLRAMGLPKELVRSSLRFSLGATTTEDEIGEAVKRDCLSAVQRLEKTRHRACKMTPRRRRVRTPGPRLCPFWQAYELPPGRFADPLPGPKTGSQSSTSRSG